MTINEIQEKLKDRNLFEKSLKTSTFATVFSKLFYLLGGTVLVAFILGNFTKFISEGSPILDFNFRMAIVFSLFLISLGFICQIIGKKMNYKVYDKLYNAYMQNPKVYVIKPLFKSEAVGYWVIAKDQSKQQELEELIKDIYQNNNGIRRNIDWALKSYAVKNRNLKDRNLKKKIIAKNTILADYDFDLRKSIYENRPKCFIYLNTNSKSKNFFPIVDQFFEIDIDKLSELN